MATATLTATPRTGTGTGVARKLRSSGQVPAIIYGHHREPQPLALDARELEKLLEHISAESTVIELNADGRKLRTLIREIQRHPFKRQILHVDFQELVAGEKITVRVPIVVTGTAAGVREGGILDHTMRELEIEVDPVNMPSHIEVDVSELTLGHSIHVGDLKLPAGVTVLDDPEASIVVLSTPKVQVEETPAAVEGAEAATPVEPEVIRKAKDEDEE